ncbi:MAG TPA: hypothetical protein PLK34_01280 [Candidatus Pacearchaeota archaeon]|nr:hypothetical protein [Candidatus Pacearchaeota archaeon]
MSRNSLNKKRRKSNFSYFESEKPEKSELILNVFSLLLLALTISFIFVPFSFRINGFVTGNSVLVGNNPSYGPQAFLTGVSDVLTSLIQSIQPVSEVILGETPEQVFISKVMLMILIFFSLWFGLGKLEPFKQGKPIFTKIVLSVVLSILFTRWVVSEELVKTVMMPYNAFGAALSAFVPLVLAFFVIELGLKGREFKILRKLGWIMVVAFFIISWSMAYKEIGNMKNPELIWTYPLGALLAFVLFFADYTIQAYLKSERAVARVDVQKKEIELAYYREIAQVREDLKNKIITGDAAKQQIKELEDKIQNLYK